MRRRVCDDDDFTLVTNYLRRVHGDLDVIIDHAENALKKIKFDTLVGRGMSGALVVPVLARELSVRYKRPIGSLVIRKPGDDSHASLPAEGKLGRRWLFVDDFISSGETRRAAFAGVTDVARRAHWKTKFVGSYLYTDEQIEPASKL
jgi:adenine/guanine phosphoribosyltransferase-like PRPP-binding protein